MRKTRRSNRILLPAAILSLVLATGLLAGCGSNKGSEEITSLEQLNDSGRTIGVSVDTGEAKLAKKVFPKAKVEQFKTEMEGYMAVSEGKLDAVIFSKLPMESAILHGLKGVKILDETVGEPNISGVGFSPKTKIPDLEKKVNDFLAEVKADGTMDDMQRRWCVENDETMPDIPVPKESDTHLVVATSGANMPFTFYAGTELTGYDIELAYRFAAWLGATIEFKVYGYDGIVAAAQSGDVDCIFANLFQTPERKEAIHFSDPTFVGEVGVMVRDPSAGQTKEQHAADFANKKIGVLTGSNFPDIISKDLPDAEQVFFNSMADQGAALKAGKIDAFAADEPLARAMQAEDEELSYIHEELEHFDFAFFMAKNDHGKKLRDDLSAFMVKLKESGELGKLQDKWFDQKPKAESMSIKVNDLSDQNGTIRVAILVYPPFIVREADEVFGYEIEILALYAKEKGYALEFVDMNADAMIPSVTSGKVDVVASATSVTEERKEEVLFTEPEYSGGVVLVTLKGQGTVKQSFSQRVKTSFKKTFIKEKRYKLFLRGIAMTLLITACAALFGTLVGFLVFMACRKGNRIANRLARFFTWLIDGMPVVVLLMILYYIIFGSVSISGAAVAIVAFTLTFGSAVYGMLKTSVATVDPGQMEAAYALAYPDRKAFYRIILPQAIPHFMPMYRGEMVALIKATAVVGYVAVQDLTKMGDIVRSRTFEAFFPLISVAIFYFILAGILIFIVNRVSRKFDPTLRKKEDILKGVKTDD